MGTVLQIDPDLIAAEGIRLRRAGDQAALLATGLSRVTGAGAAVAGGAELAAALTATGRRWAANLRVAGEQASSLALQTTIAAQTYREAEAAITRAWSGSGRFPVPSREIS